MRGETLTRKREEGAGTPGEHPQASSLQRPHRELRLRLRTGSQHQAPPIGEGPSEHVIHGIPHTPCHLGQAHGKTHKIHPEDGPSRPEQPHPGTPALPQGPARGACPPHLGASQPPPCPAPALCRHLLLGPHQQLGTETPPREGHSLCWQREAKPPEPGDAAVAEPGRPCHCQPIPKRPRPGAVDAPQQPAAGSELGWPSLLGGRIINTPNLSPRPPQPEGPPVQGCGEEESPGAGAGKGLGAAAAGGWKGQREPRPGPGQERRQRRRRGGGGEGK